MHRMKSRCRHRSPVPPRTRDYVLFSGWSVLSRAAINNKAYIRGLTHPDDLVDVKIKEETPEPMDNTPSVSHASGPSNNIPPILLLDSEVVEVGKAAEPSEESGEDLEFYGPPVLYRSQEMLIEQPDIVVNPYLVSFNLDNCAFKVILRRVRSASGDLSWNSRLYRGRNKNPTGWEPVRNESSSESEDDVPYRRST